METTKEETLKIDLKGDECKNFSSALKKIVNEDKKIGFTKSNLTDDERKIITDLSDKLNS